MLFYTVSGSAYEVDSVNKRIRRLSGKANPTPRQGKDGEWRNYAELHPAPLKVGESALIVWGDDVDFLPETKALMGRDPSLAPMRTTMTSPIESIVEDERKLS